MRYVFIENNIVTNAIVWDGETPYLAPEDVIMMQKNEVAIGDLYNPETGEFIKPPLPIGMDNILRSNNYEN